MHILFNIYLFLCETRWLNQRRRQTTELTSLSSWILTGLLSNIMKKHTAVQALLWSTAVCSWCRHQMETTSALPALCEVDSSPNSKWRRALMFSLICTWINGWVNNRKADHLRRHRAHCNVTVRYRSTLPMFFNLVSFAHLFPSYSGTKGQMLLPKDSYPIYHHMCILKCRDPFAAKIS